MYAVSSSGCTSGLPLSITYRNPGYAGFQHDGHQLCDGTEYGTQWCFKFQHCGNYYAGKCIFPDVLAVCAEDAGTDLRRGNHK